MAENKELQVYVCIPQTEHTISNIATFEAVINKIAFNNGISINLIKKSENILEISDEAEIIMESDIVISDFIPTGDTGKDPHPDSLMAAVFAKYIYSKKLIILLNDEVENYWQDSKICSFSRIDSNDSFDCLYEGLLATIDNDEPSSLSFDKSDETDKIFVTTPFQGRFFHVRNDFDFTRIFDTVHKAVEDLELSDNIITSALKEDGEIVWNDLFEQLSQSKVMIADVSPDVDSGIYPNAHVLTEYLVAKYGFGIESIFTIQRKDEKREDGHWTRFDSIEYEAFSADLDVEESNLAEVLKKEIRKGFNLVEEVSEQDEQVEIIEEPDEEVIEPVENDDEGIVIEKAEVSSEKVVVNPDIFEDADDIQDKNSEIKNIENTDEQISSTELPMKVMEDSDDSSEKADVAQESDSSEKEGNCWILSNP